MHEADPRAIDGSAPSARRSVSGGTLVLVATALVGVTGYLITWLVPRVIGVVPYATFAVFWSSTFLLTAALSGTQQEVTRATHAADSFGTRRPRSPLTFSIIVSLVTFALIAATGPLWSPAVFPGQGMLLAWPLAAAAASYVVAAIMSGTLYGVERWKAIFWMITIDGVLRFLLVAGALTFTSSPIVLAWAVAIPFPVAPLVVGTFIFRSLHHATTLDVGFGRLTWNSIRTTLASAAMGLMVSGFPVLLGLTSASVSRSTFGLVVLTTTLTRAPLIVVGMALQSFLIVLFRKHLATVWRLLGALLGVVAGLGVVLALAGWWLGPAVFRILFPHTTPPTSALIGALVASSALVGAICVTAPAVLARGTHSFFTAGWVVAAAATIILLMLPIPFLERTILSLTVAPVCGLLVHLVYLIAATRSEPDRLKT